MYGWGASSFTKPENQTPYEVPLAYSKGPFGVSLILDIMDNGEGTGKKYNLFLIWYYDQWFNNSIATRDVDYTENDNSGILLPLDPTETTSVTFRPDNFALEPEETIVFDLRLIAATPGGTGPFNPALENVFFQRRTVLSIEDSTGKFYT